MSEEKEIDFMGIRKIAAAVSGILVLVSLISLLVNSLQFGLDFTSGTSVRLVVLAVGGASHLQSSLDIAVSVTGADARATFPDASHRGEVDGPDALPLPLLKMCSPRNTRDQTALCSRLISGEPSRFLITIDFSCPYLSIAAPV